MSRFIARWFRLFLMRSDFLRQILCRVRRGYLERPRRVPRGIGVDGLFKALNTQGCRYVVLSWFDDLSGVEDFDILIDDDAAVVLDRMLTRSPRKGDVLCGVYSVHGLPSFALRGSAYYPPPVAARMLDQAVRHHSGAYVPCPEDRLYGLAFHALYHRGYSSGLPVSDTRGPLEHKPVNDYTQVLDSLARELNLSIPINMEALDQELDRKGWRPPPDTLLKWAHTNAWCGELVGRIFKDVPAPPGLMVCLVREVASDSDTIAEIERVMEAWGFLHVATKLLDEEEKGRATRSVRGGNWGRGPYPRSGGPPSVLIAAVDPTPSSPSKELRAKHPGVDNGRVFEFKKQVRNWWNNQRPTEQHCNIMHTSDSAAHAVHYLQVIIPDAVEAILERESDVTKDRSQVESPSGLLTRTSLSSRDC